MGTRVGERPEGPPTLHHHARSLILCAPMQTDIEAPRRSEPTHLASPSAWWPRYRAARFLLGFSREITWRALTRDTEGLADDVLFLRQFFLHVTALRPISKIRCTGLPGEGASSQALMIMNAIAFARAFGLTYVHTPFTRIEHAERPMQEWAAAWEALFNFGAGEAACDSDRDKSEAVEFSHNFNTLDLCFRWHEHADELARRFKSLVPEFRRKYHLDKPLRTTNAVTVAVHIRRGDVTAEYADYFTANEAILRTLNEVRRDLEAHRVNHRLRVYSQGAMADFADFSLPGVELFLDADPLWTMQELVEADILILAKGCFSFCAGLLSDGIKLFEPVTLSPGDVYLPSWKWRSAPLSANWIPCQPDGSFNSETFQRQVALLRHPRAAR